MKKKLFYNVSVVVPVYNGEKFLKKSLTSLVNQNCIFKELILIDDNSPDNSWKIIYEFFDNNSLDFDLKIVRHNANYGAAYSYTHGAFLAESKYVIFFDQDDIAIENMVETLYKTINKKKEENKRCIITVGGAIQIDENDYIINEKPIVGENSSLNEFLPRLLVRNRGCRAGGMIVDLEIFKKLNGFDSKIKSAMDWDFCIRAAQLGYYAHFLDKPLLKYRRHNKNITSNVNVGKKDAEIIYEKIGLREVKNIILNGIRNKCDAFFNYMMLFSIFKSYNGQFEQACIESEKIYNECCNDENFLFMLSVCALKNGNINKAKKLLHETLDINRDNAAALNNLGCIESINGNINNALYYLKRALAIYPTYIDANRNIEIAIKKKNKRINEYFLTLRPLREVLAHY